MTPLERAGLAVVTAGALLLGGLLLREHNRAAVADKAQQDVVRLQGERHALEQAVAQHQALADQAGQEAADQAAKAKAQGDLAASLKAKLAKLQHAGPAQAPGAVDGGAAPVDSADALKDQIIEAQDHQIEALNGQVGALGRQVGELNLQLDGKDSIIGNQDRQIRSLELALDAQKSAAKAGKWMAALKGFAVGIGSGYVAGRIHP